MTLNLLDFTPEELIGVFEGLGQPKYRAMQAFKRMHKGIAGIDEMTEFPAALRESLKQNGYIAGLPEILRKQESALDGTRKYALGLHDGNIIECVIMKYSYGASVCISSQAGCKMGCSFCASADLGFTRDLTPGEMLAQVLLAGREIGGRVSNVTVMGIGEPLDNFDNLLKFLELLNHPEGINLGMRHVTVSTCGLPEKIRALAARDLQITLSVSLHAPNDDIRRKLMPVARVYPMAEVLGAAAEYARKTGRRVTYEYALIKNVNDMPEAARELAGRLKGVLCHVNLIPVNPAGRGGYERSTSKSAADFMRILKTAGIESTLRRELGRDIDAACGQLRRSETLINL